MMTRVLTEVDDDMCTNREHWMMTRVITGGNGEHWMMTRVLTGSTG
jgi:hypothetical protein